MDSCYNRNLISWLVTLFVCASVYVIYIYIYIYTHTYTMSIIICTFLLTSVEKNPFIYILLNYLCVCVILTQQIYYIIVRKYSNLKNKSISSSIWNRTTVLLGLHSYWVSFCSYLNSQFNRNNYELLIRILYLFNRSISMNMDCFTRT